MITVTINIENGSEAAEACREVARMIDNGYTSGMLGCSGDTFDIEGDIFSDDEEEDDAEDEETENTESATESGKTEVRITAVSNNNTNTSYYDDAIYTTRKKLTELFGKYHGDSDKTNHEWTLDFDIKCYGGEIMNFAIDIYDWKSPELYEDFAIYWNISASDSFVSSIAREIIELLISGVYEDSDYKIIEVNKK